MVCKSCKKKLSTIDIYCLSCGVPTEGYREQFRLKKIIGLAKEGCSLDKTNNIFYVISVALVMIAFVYIVENNFISESYWVNYISMNLFMVLFVPLLMLTFGAGRRELEAGSLETGFIFAFKKYYMKLVIFVFLVVFYFFILRVICQGDPILNLVRLILVCWGIAIVFPVPFLIFSRDESVFCSIKKAYIAGKYLRWHQFSLSFVLAGMLLLSVLLVLVPLPYSMRFTGHLLRVWYNKQDEFQLYDKSKDY